MQIKLVVVVVATKFQPGGRAEISARAEICHVIGPLIGITIVKGISVLTIFYSGDRRSLKCFRLRYCSVTYDKSSFQTN